jgi:hypothetical protein
MPIKCLNLVFILSVAGVLTSCSSYMKRQECESTNWYSYGESVALEGRRLSGDQFISECNQAEGDIDESAVDRGFKAGLQKYCLPETVFQTGKSGNFFSTEMCTGQGLNLLIAKHRAGVLEYCKKSNGYAAGARGNPYNKICPASLEESFLLEFNRGRKRYISEEISENNNQISRIENEVTRLKTDLAVKTNLISRYQYAPQNDQSINLLTNAQNQARSLEYEILQKETHVSRLRNKNREFKLELVKLDN